LTSQAFAYSPAILAGRSGTGKTYLAKRIAREFGGRYLNVVVNHVDELVRYHSFARITPEEVARLIIRLCKSELESPVIADGLEAILGAIAFNNEHQPDILSNFFTTMKRTRDLPTPAIVVVQISELLPPEILQKTGWWNDPNFYLLELTSEDKRIIAENWQIMPTTAEKADNAIEIVLSKYLGMD
jgi:Cdc6-like AAA superfamily ATPase